jgi:hypothetical protein
MIAQTYVRFPSPITLNLRLPIEGEEHEPHYYECEDLPLILHVDAVARTISACLPPVSGQMVLYGPADYIAALADTPEELAGRVLQILGSDPADALQRMINGEELAMPVRIPREIPNWRAKATLATMGLTDQVEAIIGSLPEPQRTVVTAAWAGDAKLARTGATVTALASALGLTDTQLDQLFIAAEAIEV